MAGRFDRYFMEILIYRCPVELHTEEMAAKRRRFEAPPGQEHMESYSMGTTYFDREMWYPWNYNEVVGALRLHVLGTDFRGELWFSRARRLGARSQAPIAHGGKAFESYIPHDASSADIAAEVRRQLLRCMKKGRLRGRFLDLDSFDECARFIDWRALRYDRPLQEMGESQPQTAG